MAPCIPFVLAAFAAQAGTASPPPTWGTLTLHGRNDQVYPITEAGVMGAEEDLRGVYQLFLKTKVGEVVLTLPQSRTSCRLHFNFSASEGHGSAIWRLGARRTGAPDSPFTTWDSEEYEMASDGRGTGSADYRVSRGKISGKFKLRVARRRSETQLERFNIEGEFKEVPLKEVQRSRRLWTMARTRVIVAESEWVGSEPSLGAREAFGHEPRSTARDPRPCPPSLPFLPSTSTR